IAMRRELTDQRLDDGAHLGAKRAFDHHRVAGADRAEHLRFECRSVHGIAALAAGGKSLPQPLVKRAGTEHEIDAALLDRFGEAASTASEFCTTWRPGAPSL